MDDPFSAQNAQNRHQAQAHTKFSNSRKLIKKETNEYT